jgi:hypothetical protein
MKTATFLIASTLAVAATAGNGTGPIGAGAAGPAPHAGALLVRASPAVSPCVAAAVAAMETATGRRATVEIAAIGPVGSGRGADVVVAVEAELTRILEGGESVDDLDVDVATIPWVFTGEGAAGTTVRALTRCETRVSVFGGVISRYARQSLESLPPERVRSVKDVSIARRLPVGELALVPLSLAGPGPVSAADVPPLHVRAVGVRGSGQRDGARAFLEFLTGPAGQAAFGRCGRDATR